eukprot:scaffold182964_cov30-Tisochrysis_lutea.AAC.1
MRAREASSEAPCSLTSLVSSETIASSSTAQQLEWPAAANATSGVTPSASRACTMDATGAGPLAHLPPACRRWDKMRPRIFSAPPCATAASAGETASRWMQLRPCASAPPTLAPWLSRSATAGAWAEAHASISGVQPCRLVASIGAPASSSTAIASTFPAEAAACSAAVTQRVQIALSRELEEPPDTHRDQVLSRRYDHLIAHSNRVEGEPRVGPARFAHPTGRAGNTLEASARAARPPFASPASCSPPLPADSFRWKLPFRARPAPLHTRFEVRSSPQGLRLHSPRMPLPSPRIAAAPRARTRRPPRRARVR